MNEYSIKSYVLLMLWNPYIIVMTAVIGLIDMSRSLIILEILLLKTMAATSQAQKHAITLKGSTDIVAEFFRK